MKKQKIPKPPKTFASALRRVPQEWEGRRIPKKVRQSIAFWMLHDSLVKIDSFNGNGISCYSKENLILGGQDNINAHYREGHLFYKWLAGTWVEIC